VYAWINSLPIRFFKENIPELVAKAFFFLFFIYKNNFFPPESFLYLRKEEEEEKKLKTKELSGH
jgi:hypothetical protein